MPAGTWNLGRLRKYSTYVGLKDLGISIIDTSIDASQYFNVVDFPDSLTGGKNLFKIRASADTLVKNSKIHIEVLDSNGNPLYYEPINYLESDGTRVIAIYVYPDAADGTATVYLAGRASIDANGRSLRSSQDVNDPDYLNFPNTLWSRTVPCAPSRFNSSEIIFTSKPKVTLTEIVQPYLQPQNLTNVVTQSNGVGTCTIKPKATSVSTSEVQLNIQGDPVPVAFQGGNASNTPAPILGTQIQPSPSSLAAAEAGGVDNAVTDGLFSPTLGPLTATTTDIITALDESVFETSTPFFTSDMSPGDVITVRNPQIQPSQHGALLNSSAQAVPKSQHNEGVNSGIANLIYSLSGSYHFVIDNIITTKKAHVVLIAEPAGFKNISDSNTGGKWQVELNSADGTGQILDEVQPTSNYTCSFTLPFVYSTTEQSQSFAEIKIANIEPATGDVYKLRTYYKAGGAFGDFIDAGETIIEQLELLEDVNEFEGSAVDGAQYNRIGVFTSLADYQTYWTSSQGAISPTIGITEAFEPDDMMSGIRLTPSGNYEADDFGYIKLKDEYRPNLTKDTQYLLTVNSFADMSFTSSDSTIGNKAQLDIYISASSGTIQADELTQNAFITNAFDHYKNSLEGNFADDGPFGKRVGSIQLNASASVTPAVFRFESLSDQLADLIIVQRNGRFNIGNISLKTFNESKFTPNFTRINTRIPTQFLKTPLTFKIVFYDYLNNQAETEALIYPVTFTGENTVIDGPNNLVTGSLFIGNAVGNGIELAGVNSAYIRSIGYNGFKSASRTDTPGGFMLYTGSVLPNGPDGYAGTGIEIVQDSGSYFRFSTGTEPGIDIKTPKFFLGDKNTSISGSNGNITISGSNLDLRSNKFFLGSAASFISGANGNIEIFSNDFHLENDGSVTMEGTITATAGGDIGGWHIGTSTLTSSNGEVELNADGPYHISSSGFNVSSSGEITATAGQIGGWKIEHTKLVDVNNRLKLEPAGNYIISASNFQVTSTGEMTASAGLIGGFTIGTDNLTATNFSLNTTDKKISLGTSNTIFIADADDGIHLGHSSFGSAPFSVDTAGALKATSGVIGGWSIQSNDLTGGNMIIRDDGTIESANFASNVPGSGFRLTANDGGFLEVENARIRGTLSTTVFEKEAVNAVGGQLYIANSSVLTGSGQLGTDIAPTGTHRATDTTMSLENVSGFSAGEILTAKKVHATGFATEYIRVQSSSRFDQTSDTNFAGFIYVIRGYSGSAAAGTDSGSLGDLASSAQSYSGSQVIVSTGKEGTGYIRLNANPNDPYTPYIDIVERTGSAIYDVDLKVRLGDLSGLSQARLHGTNPTNAGFGLYSQNVFLEGGIVANTGSIAGIHMDAGKLYTGDGVHEGSGTGFYIDSGSNFSLGDKLTWDGSSLTVKGSIQLADGSNVGNGMIWSGSWNTASTYYKNDAVEYSGSSYIAIGPESHVSSNLNRPPETEATWSLMSNSGSDGVLGGDGADGADAKVVSFTSDDFVIIYDTAGSNPSPATITLSGSSQNFTGGHFKISGSAGYGTSPSYFTGSSANATSSVFTSPSSYVAGSQTLRMSVKEAASGGEIAFDTLTITSLKTAADGTDSVAPPLVTLEVPQLTFIKSIDGTITPATASFTASLQNTLSPTASWTTEPAVTLNTGSSLDLTKMYLTKDDFGTNTSVRVTVRSGSNHSDSVTMILLDEGAGNVQSVLSNQSHTFQAANNGTVTNFAGGGTTLQVFEGATELTYTSSFIVPAGHYSASLNVDNITAGTFSGDGLTTATLSIPTAMSETSGGIHITISGSTQNSTAFILPVTQSFAKSTAGAEGPQGDSAKTVTINGTTHIFTKDITGTITPISASFTASLNNATATGDGWATTLGSFASRDNNFAGPPVCVVTRDTFVDGMRLSYTMHADDNEFADSVTLKLIDAGSGNVQSILSNQSHTFQADHTGSVTDFTGGGTSIQVFEGATLLTYTSSANAPSGFYSASFVSDNITPGAFTGNDTTTAIFASPTAISANTAELRITISGSSQNGTSFLLPMTQSFAKSIAGAEPIIAVQTNESHTFVGDPTGSILSFAGSGTTISVFEGVTQLEGITAGAVATGQFQVSSSGDNITPGTTSSAALNVIVGDHSTGTETSGSITYTITGKSLGNTSFTRTKTQTFNVASAGTNAKTILVTPDSYFFVKDITGTYTPATASISGSGQNLIADGNWSTTAGTLTNELKSTNNNVVHVTRDNFVDGMVVTFTADSPDGSISDSVTLKELDAGSGNIQSVLSNQSHTFPAALNGDVTSFIGGGTTLQVFEGATALTYDLTPGQLGAGEWSASLNVDNITAGTFSGDSDTTATLSIPTAMSETSGAIHITVTGFTQNNTAFTSSMTQSFAKSIQGVVGDTGGTGDTGATGATGATGPNFDFLTGSLSEIDTTGNIAAGLLLTSDVFGFHGTIDEGDGTAATLSDFTSFLDSSGNFYLGSGSGDLGAGYFAWNNTDKSLLISGSAVDVRVDKFYLGRTGQYISGSEGNIEISSSNFHLQPDGDVVMQGNVTASGIRIEGDSTFQGAVTITNPNDFADVAGNLSGSQLYENFQSRLDSSKWMTGSLIQKITGSTYYGAQHSGSVFGNGNGAGNNYNAGFVSNQVFLRSDATTLEVDFVTAITNPNTYIGFVSESMTLTDIETATNIFHMVESIQIASQDISIYADDNNNGTAGQVGSKILGDNIWSNDVDTFWKLRLTLKPSGGARYEMFKNGDFTTPFSSHDTTGNLAPKVKVFIGMVFQAENANLHFSQLGVNRPIQSTRISGNSIQTGIITSNNYSAVAGSEIDLDGGTIKLGGSASPKFSVNASGSVSASSGVIGGWTLGVDSFTGGQMQISSSGLITTNTNTDKTRIVIDGSTDPSEIRFFSGSVKKFEFTTDIDAFPEQPFVTASGGTPACLAAENTGISGIQLTDRASGIVSTIGGADESISIVPGRVYIHGKQSSSLQGNTEQLKVRRDLTNCLGSDELDTPASTQAALFEYQSTVANPGSHGKRFRSAVTAKAALTHANNSGTAIAVYADGQVNSDGGGKAYSFFGNSGSFFNRNFAGFGQRAGTTTFPSHQVHIQSENDTTPLSIDIGDSATFNFEASSSSGYVTTFRQDDTGLDIGHGSSARTLNLKTNDTDRLIIDGAGKVGIGTDPDTPFHIKQTGTGKTNGITIERGGATTYWNIWQSSAQLNFRYNGGSNGGFIANSADVSNITFTGQHKNLPSIGSANEYSSSIGYIVCSTGTYDNLYESGSSKQDTKPNINEALPKVKLSNTPKDKTVFGVIAEIETSGSRTHQTGTWGTSIDVRDKDDVRLIINSVGEGAIWVSNYSGSLENGDYITSSPIEGLGMRQSDDLLRNYTVAKITQDCTFDMNASASYDTVEFEYSGSTYKRSFVGCTYHCG